MTVYVVEGGLEEVGGFGIWKILIWDILPRL